MFMLRYVYDSFFRGHTHLFYKSENVSMFLDLSDNRSGAWGHCELWSDIEKVFTFTAKIYIYIY
jgi:hypothetical protein